MKKANDEIIYVYDFKEKLIDIKKIIEEKCDVNTEVARISFGFGDGMLILEAGKPYVLINSCKAKIIGIWCNDICNYEVMNSISKRILRILKRKEYI